MGNYRLKKKSWLKKGLAVKKKSKSTFKSTVVLIEFIAYGPKVWLCGGPGGGERRLWDFLFSEFTFLD